MDTSVMTTASDDVARLRMDARYHRERRDLYRAKAYGPHATSPQRLREREEDYERAAERLRVAEARAEEQSAVHRGSAAG